MKKLFLALLVSAVTVGSVALILRADQRRGTLEGVIARLDVQLERSEDRIAELQASQTALVTALRERSTEEADVLARIGTLERDLEARVAKLAATEPAGPAASIEELQEVVAAVNDLVATVDELSVKTGLTPVEQPAPPQPELLTTWAAVETRDAALQAAENLWTGGKRRNFSFNAAGEVVPTTILTIPKLEGPHVDPRSKSDE